MKCHGRILAAALLCCGVGCSNGGAGDQNGTPVVRTVGAPLAVTPAAVTSVQWLASLAPELRRPAWSMPGDRGYPVSLFTYPDALCFVQSQAGTTVVHRQGLSADLSGVVRFFPPSADWGTVLDVDCVAGKQHASYRIDLADASSFVTEPDFEGPPQIIGVRPALTGRSPRPLSERACHGRIPAATGPVGLAGTVFDVARSRVPQPSNHRRQGRGESIAARGAGRNDQPLRMGWHDPGQQRIRGRLLWCAYAIR